MFRDYSSISLQFAHFMWCVVPTNDIATSERNSIHTTLTYLPTSHHLLHATPPPFDKLYSAETAPKSTSPHTPRHHAAVDIKHMKLFTLVFTTCLASVGQLYTRGVIAGLGRFLIATRCSRIVYTYQFIPVLYPHGPLHILPHCTSPLPCYTSQTCSPCSPRTVPTSRVVVAWDTPRPFAQRRVAACHYAGVARCHLTYGYLQAAQICLLQSRMFHHVQQSYML